MDSGSLVNSAEVVGTPPGGGTVSDTDAVTLTAPGAAAISLTKTSTDSNVELHDWVYFTLTAENTGGVTLSDVTIDDAMPGVHFDGGCHPVTLAPGETLTCVTRYHVMQDDMDTGSIVNDASVTGTPSAGPDVTDTASVTVTTLDAPAIGVTVTPDIKKYKKAGQVIHFDVVTTNTGVITLNHTQLDTLLPGADTSDCDAIDATLAPGASVTCVVTYVVAPEDLQLEELVLGVFARGQSHTLASVTASAATGAIPDVTLAATGADAIEQARLSFTFLLAGLFLILLARRSREEEEEDLP